MVSPARTSRCGEFPKRQTTQMSENQSQEYKEISKSSMFGLIIDTKQKKLLEVTGELMLAREWFSDKSGPAAWMEHSELHLQAFIAHPLSSAEQDYFPQKIFNL